MKFLLEHGSAGLFLDPGLGKTSITLGAISELKKAGMMHKALVIAPRRVVHNVWPEEVKKWSQFGDLRVAVLHGPEKKRLAALKSEADIYLINPEGLPWLMGNPALFEELSPDVLVVDESSKFKHTNTQRFKLLKPYLPKFRRRWILTGSPMPNGYLDLFGQLYILDLGHSLGAFITHYRINYFFPTGYGGYTWVLKPGADKLIQERIKPYALRMEAKDYLQLPERIENTVRVTLPDDVRELYDAMEEEMFVTLEGDDIQALSAAAASNKCSQIANGGLYFDKWEERGEERLLVKGWKELHNVKTEAVEDLVEEASGVPCIVAYDFHHDRERLLKAFGKDTPVLGGGTSDKAADAIIKAWNLGKIPVLLAQPSSMGHGLNLQTGGNHIILHSLTYDYEVYDQFILRILRQGASFDHVFVHHVIATKTVDEAKMRAMKSKAKTQTSFMDSLKAYAASRRPEVRETQFRQRVTR